MGRLIQPPPAAQLLRRRSTCRVRTALLPSDGRAGSPPAGRTEPPLNPERLSRTGLVRSLAARAEVPDQGRDIREDVGEVHPVTGFPTELCRVINTTNSIESLNFQHRKIHQVQRALPPRFCRREAALPGHLQHRRHTGCAGSPLSTARHMPTRAITGRHELAAALAQLTLAYPTEQLYL